VLINNSKHICASQAVLNKWLKLDLHQLKKFVYIICAENSLETFRSTSDQICLMEIYLQPYCIEICQVTRPLTSEEIRTITNNLHLICAEYERQTRLTPPQGSRVLALDITAHLWRRKPGKMTQFKYCNSCIGIRQILSVLNMDLNMTFVKSRNSCYYARLTVCLYWIWTGNVTREKWWNKCPRWNSSVINTASELALGQLKM